MCGPYGDEGHVLPLLGILAVRQPQRPQERTDLLHLHRTIIVAETMLKTR